MELKELGLEPGLLWDVAVPRSGLTIVPLGPDLKGFLLSEIVQA